MSVISRNGRSTSFPSRTIRILPACSTTNSDDGSFGRQVMSTGSCSPDTNGSIDRRGGVSPVGPPLGVAPVGAALDGIAADGGAETTPVGGAGGPGGGGAGGAGRPRWGGGGGGGWAADDGEGVGLLQPTSARTTSRARRRRRPIPGC